jgi:hypothetical protein
VFWEGSSDPAEDQKEAEDEWWASMPKPVLARGRRCAAGPCAHCCAQGAADRGNYLFVGFPMNGIKP